MKKGREHTKKEMVTIHSWVLPIFYRKVKVRRTRHNDKNLKNGWDEWHIDRRNTWHHTSVHAHSRHWKLIVTFFCGFQLRDQTPSQQRVSNSQGQLIGLASKLNLFFSSKGWDLNKQLYWRMATVEGVKTLVSSLQFILHCYRQWQILKWLGKTSKTGIRNMNILFFPRQDSQADVHIWLGHLKWPDTMNWAQGFTSCKSI
jgi:hypothetical protein